MERSRGTIWIRYLSLRKGLIWRGLLCWAIGCLVLSNDELNSFDTRFAIRGEQPISNQLAIVRIQPADLSKFYQQRAARYAPTNEVSNITDSYYWNQKLWFDLLRTVLAQQPKSVGVTLFFGEPLGPLNLSREERQIFFNPKVYWASLSAIADHPQPPLLQRYDQSNIGDVGLLRDDDGVIRRFYPANKEVPHLVERITGIDVPTFGSKFINYRGTRFLPEFSVRDILDGQISSSALRDKIVLIGSESASEVQFLTPLGPSSRASVLAQITDNLLLHRWILRPHQIWYALGLFFLMTISVFIMAQYPSGVALVFLIWLGTLSTALSAWVFDTFYIWIPVISPLVQLSATYVIFLGYQANKIERKHWQLQQEQKYLQELEQLKNNFVSLISHDLKTPIAKIQAIIDRLLVQHSENELANDLKNLRMSSEELHRYIQSILKVLRVESRDFKLHLHIGDMNDLIQEAVEQLKPLASEKNIEIKLQLEPMFSMEMDFVLMKEVMINLIENAIKYTPEGGFIAIHSREEENRVQVDVIDSGDGIPENELQQVWGKFVRGRDQDYKTKGSGLGLYLVKYFIELHGGQVWLKSEIKKGTTVSFALPLEAFERSTPI